MASSLAEVEAVGASGADVEAGSEESGDEQGRASGAVQDLVAEMEDAEGEFDDAEDEFYQQRVAVAEERRLLEQEAAAADGEEGETPGPSGSAAGGGGEDVEFDGGLRVPAQLFDQLFAYQKTGVKWLWELYTQRAGGIVADEMGLGKTAQVVAFLAGLHRSGMYRPSLVVCPATVLRQWMREVRRWYPPFRCIILHDAGRSPSGLRPGKEELVRMALSSDAGLLVTTYDQLRLQKALLLGIEWGCAVLDEGHKIRNPDADITLTCKQLATVHRYIMTGSPIQNRLTELWSLFDYVFPGKLGTLPVFQTEFSIPIQVGGYVNASRVQVTTAYRCALVLRDLIAPYLLRRIKADVQAQLPNKTEQVLFCKLTAHQRTLYRQYLASSEVSEILAGSRNALMGIDTLRKICNHPDLLERDTAEGSDTYGDPSRCGKLQVFLKVLRLWCSQDHKVLVFTQTQQMLDILQRHVNTEGLTWHRMDGSTSVRQRSRLIDDFNNSTRVQVFLLTTRVGGLGVNLTGASRVVLYDPDWNPSTDMQARERAWRIGQKRDVTIYRLITSGTIEEKVYHRQVFKQFLTNRILRDPRQKRFFSSKGMADLFTLGPEEDASGASETASIFRSIQGEVLPPGSPAADREPAAGTPENAAAAPTSAPATPPEQASGPGCGATPPKQRGRGRRRRSDEAGDTDEEEEDEEEEGGGGGQEEESRILQELFSATGITSALDHSKIESANDPEVLREDTRAAAVARQAAEALRRSRRECQANGVHVPTWTGRSGEAGAPSLFNRRFGATRNPALPEPRPAASASPPALGSSAAPSRPAAGLVPGAGAALSSQELLARIQARRQGRATASSSTATLPSGTSNDPSPEVESAQQMMTMIIDFLTQHGGSAQSAHLIQHFDGVVPQQQLPVFRHVLKQVAVLNRRNGQGWWQLRPQHSGASAPGDAGPS